MAKRPHSPVSAGQKVAATSERSGDYALAGKRVWVAGHRGMVGAALMYALGRRYGPALIRGRLLHAGPDAEKRIDDMYRRHGLWALALSRFIPGVRAIVPPFAGALRLSPLRALLAMAVASGVWYGAITVLAYRLGSSWEALRDTVARAGAWTAVGATAIALVGVGVWFMRRRRG